MNDQNSKTNLAIVIPAYKRNFLHQALQSLASQTDKNFCIYIGDDNSPQSLYNIVEGFEKLLHIVYHKFPDNLGGVSLTKQWERCIDLCRNEEWIWLFSDDDVATATCVADFGQALEKTQSEFDIYKFPTSIIDNSDNLIRQSSGLPEVINSEQFLKKVLSFETDSFAVEYIFRKEYYLASGKFVEFPLAWCSDIATWAKLGKSKGIYSMKSTGVLWRYSGLNLSSDISRNYEIKQHAIFSYLNWLKVNFPSLNTIAKIQIRFLIQNAIHHRRLSKPNDISTLLLNTFTLFPAYKSYICIQLIRSSLQLQYIGLKESIKLFFKEIKYKN